MRYIGEKFTEEQAAAIMTEARATCAAVRADMARWAEQQRGGAEFITKTITNARVADAPAQTMDAQTASWVEWVDARIEEEFDIAIEAVGQVVGQEREDFQDALRRRDAEIQTLKREVASLRDEIDLKLGLKAKVARLKAEISEARVMQPNFEAELKGLRETTEKQERLITKLRAEQSQLSYAQGQLEKQQQKSHSQIRMTEIELTSVGAGTRTALRALEQEGIDIWEMPPLSRLPS